MWKLVLDIFGASRPRSHTPVIQQDHAYERPGRFLAERVGEMERVHLARKCFFLSICVMWFFEMLLSKRERERERERENSHRITLSYYIVCYSEIC